MNEINKKAVSPKKVGTSVYVYESKEYATKSALVFGYLDHHRVHTGLVKPRSVAQFVSDTGVQATHGFFGARLDEYCKRERKDGRGRTYIIDRKPLNKGAKSGRKYVARLASKEIGKSKKPAAVISKAA